MRKKASYLVMALAMSSAATMGCSSLKTSKTDSKKSLWAPSTWFAEEPYQTPTSMAVIWSPDTLTVTGQPPTRGFGGRVFFYNKEMKAIPVNGDLKVHGFLKESEARGDIAADKSFSFTADQLTQHFSPSELGASYSIWIPWDAAGGLRQQVSLVPTFKSIDGAVVQGAAAKLLLPGKSPDNTEEELPAPMMQRVSYTTRVTPSNEPFQQQTPSLRTTEISVPSSSSLTRRKNPSFTLGGGTIQTANPPQGVSAGGSTTDAMPQSVGVGGGGQRPSDSGSISSPSASRTSIQPLGIPPTTPAPAVRPNVANAPSGSAVVPAGFQSN